MIETITSQKFRELLYKNGYYDDNHIKIEEGKSENIQVNNLLKYASKKGTNKKGYPDFIISFINDIQNIIVVECKADIKNHNKAIEESLHYASYLKKDFNVIAIAFSGQNLREIKISQFLWLKQRLSYKDLNQKKVATPNDIFSIFNEFEKPIKEEELTKHAIRYNKNLNDYSIPEVERCTYISSILVALQDNSFLDSYESHHKKKINKNPNQKLIKSLLAACESVLENNEISPDKRDIIKNEYAKINSNKNMFSNDRYDNKLDKDVPNTILRDLITDIRKSILPYVEKGWFDVLGRFYTQFIRYAGKDAKKGLVLTPPHIAEFFCDISNLTENDVVLDTCCGTGGFLVSAMNKMFTIVGNNENLRKSIKKNKIIGVEIRSDMFSHACSNMMMRGDGKSHIYHDDCRKENLKNEIITKTKPTKIFLNPPYDVGPAGQLKLIEHSLDYFNGTKGTCVAIVQMSAILSKEDVIEVKSRLLKKHTLEAVFSMPTELFHPVGVVTSIIILQANEPHPENKDTFLGYFKNDGFIKVKHKGRIDEHNKWNEIKEFWLDTFLNRKSIKGLSIMQKLNADDEWCAEAYLETDYSSLTKKDFEESIKNYVYYRFINEIE